MRRFVLIIHPFLLEIFPILIFSSIIYLLKIKRYLEIFLKKCSAASVLTSDNP